MFEKTAEIDVEEIKEFSQKLNQSSRKQFEGIYFSDKYVNKFNQNFNCTYLLFCYLYEYKKIFTSYERFGT